MRKSTTLKSPTKSSKSSSQHLYYFPLSCVILDGATNLLTSLVDAAEQEQPQQQQDYPSSPTSLNHINLHTNDSSSTGSASPSIMTFDSNCMTSHTDYHRDPGRSFTVPCISELRDRFQRYIKETSTTSTRNSNGNDSSLVKLHKLMFLDEFFDPTRNRRKKMSSCEAFFGACDQYLTLIHVQSKNSLAFSLLDTFPYLQNFDEMQKIQPKNSVLQNHEYLIKWFRKQSENLKKYLAEKAKLNESLSLVSSPVDDDDHIGSHEEADPVMDALNDSMASPTLSGFINSPTKSLPSGGAGGGNVENENTKLEEYLDESEMKLLIHMLSTELEDYFALFQKSNSKYMKKWLERNVKSLPNYIIDLISKRRKKYMHYHDNYKLSEEDLNMKTILDSDFEFIQYLGEHTEDWSILNADSPLITSYKSKENYSKIPDMKMQKYISKVDYPLENVLKTLLCNVDELSEKDSMIESSQFHHYTDIDPNISSRKYSSVIQTSLLNYGSIFKKRSLENVISCKGSFCSTKEHSNETIFEAVHLYKTCTYVSRNEADSKAPVKVVIVGGRIYSRIDTNRTRVVDVRMFNVGGTFFNSDFVIHTLSSKKMIEDTWEYLDKSMKKAEKEGFPLPDQNRHFIWRTFADYCRVHCKVDISHSW